MNTAHARIILQGLIAAALLGSFGSVQSQTFVHPGALSTSADFARMTAKVNANAQPWLSGWNKLLVNPRSSSGYAMQGPVPIVYRGTGSPENYGKLYNDIAAVYQNSLRWRIKGDTACANKAVAIMDAWSGILTSIQGSADRWLAAGIYGYEFACAAENMRGYGGWSTANFTRFQNMMKNVFYPMNHDFLVRHNGACITNYWANWDLCSIASIIAIGVLCDDQAKYDEAVNYWKTGAGNGSIDHAVPFAYNNGTLGQGQEEGRDQGHAGLNVSLQGPICQIAYNQGLDLFGWENNKILAMCEYFADYNLGNTVPFTTYNWGTGTTCAAMSQTIIAAGGQGDIRPSWALIYSHYHGLKGLAATFCGQYVTKVGVEGGGGDYGPNSGGYDQLGFGTLTSTLESGPTSTLTPAPVNRSALRSIRVESRRIIIGLNADVQSNVMIAEPNGKIVDRRIVNPGEQVYSYDSDKLPAGIYFVQVKNRLEKFSQAVVIAP